MNYSNLAISGQAILGYKFPGSLSLSLTWLHVKFWLLFLSNLWTLLQQLSITHFERFMTKIPIINLKYSAQFLSIMKIINYQNHLIQGNLGRLEKGVGWWLNLKSAFRGFALKWMVNQIFQFFIDGLSFCRHCAEFNAIKCDT